MTTRGSRSAPAVAPPKLAGLLLRGAIGRGEWSDSILGDLHEEYVRRHRVSARRAALWYCGQAARLAARYSTRRGAGRLVLPPTAIVNIPDRHGDSMMRTIALETRHAIRSLLKRPSTTAIVVMTLALCLGANAAIFAIVDALVIRPFRFAEPERIAFAIQTQPDGADFRQETVSAANFLDWRRHVTTIEQLSAFAYWDVNLVGRDEPERVQGFRVSPGFFEALRVQPAGGRAFSTAEETFGEHRKVVLGHGLWQRRFGGDAGILGQAINLNGEQYEVVGIAPAAFDFPMGSQLWVPLAFDAQAAARRDRRFLNVLGRLAPGRTLDEAHAELATIAKRLEQEHPDVNRGRGARVYTLAQGMMDIGLGPILSMWQASALFVLLIGCANIANLLLARAAERERELAVRLAIGASRGRVIRQMLIESVLLGLMAVPGAMLAAYIGLKVLVSYMPARIARFVAGWQEIDIDGRLLLVTVALAFGTAILFGLLPAFHSSRPRISEALKSGGRSVTAGRQRLRRTLVIAEIALALPLLVAAGLSAVGVNRFLNGPQGYNPDGVLTMRAVLSEGRHPDANAWRRFTEQALERLSAIPGVEAAAAANTIPSFTSGASRPIEIDGQPVDTNNRPIVQYRVATPRMFDVLQLPILSGRAFVDTDRSDSQAVTIVSQSMARRYWADIDPIGRRLRIAGGDWLTIVGVCGDVIHDWFDARNQPMMYRPYAQAPTGFMALLVRTSNDPKHAVADALTAIKTVDPAQPVFNVMTYREVLDERTIGLQYVAAIMLVFGIFALVLAVVGVYSVMAFMVAQRTHEIGVRMALGATRSDVMKLTVGQAGRLTLAGVVIGGLLAVALGRLIEAGLLGIVSSDYRMIAAFGLLLVATALIAGYLPARRAAAIEPIVALRAE
jgi:putative ABC transport system permease protein